jgi:hypothetical protein
MYCYENEYNLNPLTRNNWRASLVPAAAVIPAPIAYIKVVAVKKLVVEVAYCSETFLLEKQEQHMDYPRGSSCVAFGSLSIYV